MAKPNLTGSAGLHLKLGAFCVLFTALAGSFSPITAFGLAIVASLVLAKL
jgi:hypothetical protein